MAILSLDVIATGCIATPRSLFVLTSAPVVVRHPWSTRAVESQRFAWGLFAAVLVLHAGVVWILRQYVAVQPELPKPAPLAVNWVTLPTPTAPPEPLSAPRSNRVSASLPPPATPPTVAVTQPTALPVPLQAAESASVTPEAPTPTPATTAPAVANPAPAAAPPSPQTLIPPSAIRYLEAPAPQYPRASRRLGETGTVVVRVYVDEAGLPRTVQVAQSSGFTQLDDAAVAAVQQARFVPYLENGRATAGWARIPFPFELE